MQSKNLLLLMHSEIPEKSKNKAKNFQRSVLMLLLVMLSGKSCISISNLSNQELLDFFQSSSGSVLGYLTPAGFSMVTSLNLVQYCEDLARECNSEDLFFRPKEKGKIINASSVVKRFNRHLKKISPGLTSKSLNVEDIKKFRSKYYVSGL